MNPSTESQELPASIALLRTPSGLFFIKNQCQMVVLMQDDWTPQELRAIADYLEHERVQPRRNPMTPSDP